MDIRVRFVYFRIPSDYIISHYFNIVNKYIIKELIILNYQYPDNLRAKPVLWFWELKHIVVIGVCAIISVLAFSLTKSVIPLVLAAVYAFLTIRMDDRTILDYIKHSVQYFIAGQQTFFWR